mmetsp:Transcript_99909/g.172278  ORF Transcript_99909/g.172278 Transcript_99909/m.172278 type:complete len:364 (+) Transcript_99909:1898-2989(+)
MIGLDLMLSTWMECILWSQMSLATIRGLAPSATTMPVAPLLRMRLSSITGSLSPSTSIPLVSLLWIVFCSSLPVLRCEIEIPRARPSQTSFRVIVACVPKHRRMPHLKFPWMVLSRSVMSAWSATTPSCLQSWRRFFRISAVAPLSTRTPSTPQSNTWHSSTRTRALCVMWIPDCSLLVTWALKTWASVPGSVMRRPTTPPSTSLPSSRGLDWLLMTIPGPLQNRILFPTRAGADWVSTQMPPPPFSLISFSFTSPWLSKPTRTPMPVLPEISFALMVGFALASTKMPSPWWLTILFWSNVGAASVLMWTPSPFPSWKLLCRKEGVLWAPSTRTASSALVLTSLYSKLPWPFWATTMPCAPPA